MNFYINTWRKLKHRHNKGISKVVHQPKDYSLFTKGSMSIKQAKRSSLISEHVLKFKDRGKIPVNPESGTFISKRKIIRKELTMFSHSVLP